MPVIYFWSTQFQLDAWLEMPEPFPQRVTMPVDQYPVVMPAEKIPGGIPVREYLLVRNKHAECGFEYRNCKTLRTHFSA